jgi:Cu(I)/Ag(I) efflux system protein CusF
MKHIFEVVFAFSLAIMVSIPVAAMDAMDMPNKKKNVAKVISGTGVVVKVNKEAGTLILKHEPIQTLQWPAMTMSFEVKNKAQLHPLKKGDKVEFTLERAGSEYLINDIK